MKGITMQEEEVRFKSGEMQLAGTMALPDSGGPFPAVLFLAGSGQTDRNENNKRLHINAFYDISHYLAQNGIASIRYDKRGVGQSEGDHWATGFYDHAQDALAALQYLKQQASIQAESIFMLGHSEGAFLAVKLAGSGVEVAGIILLAGGAQSGEAVLKWQVVQVARGLKGINGWLIKALRIDVLKAQQKHIDRIKRSKKDWYRVQLIAKINAKWLREFMTYDPSEDLPKITVPVLAIAGSKDIQVDPGDLERMARLVKAPFEQHLIQDMTHILRTEEGDSTISKYKKEIKRPIEPKVLEIVLRWLEHRILSVRVPDLRSLDVHLRSGSHAVRIAAAEKLAEAGQEGALILIQALKEGDNETYEAAAWGIEVPLVEQGRGGLPKERLHEILRPATEYLIEIVKQAEILKGAAAYDKRVSQAIGALGAIGDPEALPALGDLLARVRGKIEVEGVVRERVHTRETFGWISTEDGLRDLERQIERIKGSPGSQV
jgi:pimeloyl-ACP methyl ester carboxylesterase